MTREDYIQSLEDEGFSQDEITEALELEETFK
jgi:DNA-binding transcriptional MerR regulator